MKNLLDDAYKKTDLMRCVLTLLFGIIAYIVFSDIYIAIFTVVVITLAHELPTIFMAWYIFRKENLNDYPNDR